MIYNKKEGISGRKLGSDLMLYDQSKDKVHILNETGALVWKLVDGKNNPEQIADAFQKEFPDTKPEVISKDVSEIIEKLVSEGLITPVTS